MRAEATAAGREVGSSDARVIGLITIAHFFSHLYILALPPLFPVLSEALGVGAFELGVALAASNLTTALLQAPVGFLVDRYGAAAILIGGQCIFALSIGLIGTLTAFAPLLVLMILAGLGNSVYHPADYAVLSARIASGRAGRAFAIHTFGGYAGFAAAPMLMVGLNDLFGWRAAFAIIGLAGILFTLVMIRLRHDLVLARPATPPERTRPATSAAGFLASPAVLLALAFFTCLAITHTGFSAFTTLVLERAHGFDLARANLAATIFLSTSALGVLAGGWVADASAHHARIVAACTLVMAAAALLIAVIPPMFALLSFLFVLAGFASGLIAPSRDTLVKQLAAPGQTGRVFGFVTTGFNIGALVAPPAYGLLVDLDAPLGVFWLVAGFGLITAFTVLPARSYR